MNVENKDDFRVVAFFTSSVGRSESKRLTVTTVNITDKSYKYH
jgi:hypothetical protein